MVSKLNLPLICCLLVFTANTAVAHPGHGASPPESVFHQLTEPLHSWKFLLIGGVLLFTWTQVRRNSWARFKTRPSATKSTHQH